MTVTATERRGRGVTGKATSGASMDAIITRIRSEYREMPGLHLTFDQMRRLWMLDSRTCRTLVEKLVDAQFLKATRDGHYVRCDLRQSHRAGDDSIKRRAEYSSQSTPHAPVSASNTSQAEA